jgi:hypothetical protein
MHWNEEELTLLRSFKEPYDIQRFLDSIPYDEKDEAGSPRKVIRERKAMCFEGALFAAAALQFLGREPLLLDMRAVNDDDHVIAIFKDKDLFGAVAKSNFTTLRFREPVYRNLRELVMSYFDFYFNTRGEKTLRSYSLPLNLKVFGDEWQTREESLDYIGEALDRRRHFAVMKEGIKLHVVDDLLLRSGLMGSNSRGLYKPEKNL